MLVILCPPTNINSATDVPHNTITGICQNVDEGLFLSHAGILSCRISFVNTASGQFPDWY